MCRVSKDTAGCFIRGPGKRAIVLWGVGEKRPARVPQHVHYTDLTSLGGLALRTVETKCKPTLQIDALRRGLCRFSCKASGLVGNRAGPGCAAHASVPNTEQVVI